MLLVELVDHPLARAGTLALLHFLWQGVLIALGLAAAVELLGIRRKSWRYACSLAALLLMAAMPLATVGSLMRSPSSSTVSDVTNDLASFRMSMSNSAWHPAAVVLRAQPYILAVWTTGVAFFSCRLLFGVIGVWQLRRDRIALPRELAHRLTQFESRLRMSTRSLVFLSYRVREAVAIGLVRPIVLIPVAWATEMPPALLEAIVAHELAHLRRWDVWVNVLQRIVEALLFYHPAVWWLSRRMRIEREFCCDELAVNLTGRRLEYAQALEIVARGEARVEPLFAASIRGEKHMQVLQRVQNVLGMSSVKDRSRVWPAGLLALLLPLGAWVGTAGLVSADSSVTAVSDDDDDDDDDKPTAKLRERLDDDDDRPAAKRNREKDDDDDDKPSAKRNRDEDDDDDKPAAKKGSRDDDDDRPAAKRGREEDDDDDKPGKKRYGGSGYDRGDGPKTRSYGEFGGKSGEFSAQQDPRTREDDEVAPKPKKSAKNAYSRTTVRGKSDTVEKGDERVAELQAMVEKLMAENKRLRAELNELRDDGGPAKVKDPSRNYRSEVEGQYRKLFGDKRAAGEKGDGKWKLDGAVEQKVLLEQELKQEIDGQQKEGKARQRRLEEATGRHKELLQQKLKQAIAEKEEHVLKLQLKELAEQIDESAQEQKLKEVIVQEIEEARKRAEVDNKRERDDGGKDDAK